MIERTRGKHRTLSQSRVNAFNFFAVFNKALFFVSIWFNSIQFCVFSIKCFDSVEPPGRTNSMQHDKK